MIVLLLFLVPAGPAFGLQAAPGTATVTVLHALPAFTADVYVNGDLTLSGFEPETATDPLELAAGRYTLEIRDVGAAPDSDPALEGTVRLRAGQNLSIIAGLTEAGEPALNVFENDTTRIAPGRSRLIVRNVAEAASFGVQLDGEDVFRGVPNGSEKSRDLEAGVYSFEATGGQSSIGPEDLVLEEGTTGIVYTVGSAEGETLELMFQTVRGMQGDPGSVLTGDGGLAAAQGPPPWATVTVLFAVLGLAGSAAVLFRRRSAGDRLRLG